MPSCGTYIYVNSTQVYPWTSHTPLNSTGFLARSFFTAKLVANCKCNFAHEFGITQSCKLGFEHTSFAWGVTSYQTTRPSRLKRIESTQKIIRKLLTSQSATDKDTGKFLLINSFGTRISRRRTASDACYINISLVEPYRRIASRITMGTSFRS